MNKDELLSIIKFNETNFEDENISDKDGKDKTVNTNEEINDLQQQIEDNSEFLNSFIN